METVNTALPDNKIFFFLQRYIARQLLVNFFVNLTIRVK